MILTTSALETDMASAHEIIYVIHHRKSPSLKAPNTLGLPGEFHNTTNQISLSTGRKGDRDTPLLLRLSARVTRVATVGSKLRICFIRINALL